MTLQHLPPDLAASWASSAQFRFLDALMADPGLACDEFAFHGGTSLHFSWRSPRRSEDLDFLTALTADAIRAAVERAHGKAVEAFLAEDPRFIVELRDKTRSGDRMIAYQLVVSHPDYLGKTLVKVEFWRVNPGYLAGYPVEFRAPVSPGDIVSRISNPVPAATLETAYCDKLTAFATRSYLKWRDIHDLWWIGTQTDARLELSTVVPQFLHNVRAYDTIDDLPPAQALRRFLTTHDPDAVIRKADPDLKRWLPDGLWARLHPAVTTEMVRYVWYALERVADAIEKNDLRASLKRVSS
ncbi:MAG TPA: nucleotidyl transferase AbiEii/AbiGii toxin family protein [Steroidobacteraceae bacterium]|nr:nucleotidyl transferase AbiEii/AbiGii toxin family protein [Steroidobacteraceae bacterium]